jgi:hypothetical protein
MLGWVIPAPTEPMKTGRDFEREHSGECREARWQSTTSSASIPAKDDPRLGAASIPAKADPRLGAVKRLAATEAQ